MPGSDIAQVLGTVFKKTEEQAQEEQEKFDKERSQDIEMYRSVLMNSDPLITPEQRHKAAEWIQKLRNIKKDKPFSRLAGFLNIMHGMKNKQAPGSQPQVQAQPQQGQTQPQGKPGIMGRIAGGAGRMIQGTLGSHPAELPPLDTSVFQGQNPMTVYRKQLKEAVPGITDEQLNKAVEQKFGAAPKPKFVTKVVEDADSPTGRSYVTYDEQTGQEVSRQKNAPKPPSEEPRQTDTTSTDPYGGKTTTHSERKIIKPSTNGQGQRKPMQPPPNAQTPPISQPGASNGQSRGMSKPPDVAGSSPKLDSEGHIPASSGINERVREAANQLLDGQDINKIPEKGREMAAKLARSYGWEQGKFTPKEQVALKEATTFINEAASNKSLAVLDESFMDRYKLQQVMKNPDKEGFIGRGISLMAAQNLTPQQQEFVRMYNQLVGTISGLSQLVRPGSRATEATIERLKAELPNPITTANSQDAKARLQRIQKEIAVALDKGNFESSASKSSSESAEDILRKHKVIK